MTEKQNVSSENTPVVNSESNTEKTVKNSDNDPKVDPKDEKKDDIIAYEKYRQLLDETKKEREERKKLEEKIKSFEEEKMKEKEQWKELSIKREQELKELRDAADRERQAFIESRKAQAFINAVGGLKHEKYMNLVDTSRIEYKDGSVDEKSLLSYVDEFKRECPELLKVKSVGNTLPNDAPKSHTTLDTSKMSYNELKKFYKNMKG